MRKQGKKSRIVNLLSGIRLGFFFMAAALILLMVGYNTFFETMNAFGFDPDRWVILLTISSLAIMGFILLNSLIMGDQAGIFILYLLAAGMIAMSICLYLQPCLSPIAIYFSVGNMGDVEANAIGVPSVIRGCIYYLVSIICLIFAGFSTTVKAGHALADPVNNNKGGEKNA